MKLLLSRRSRTREHNLSGHWKSEIQPQHIVANTREKERLRREQQSSLSNLIKNYVAQLPKTATKGRCKVEHEECSEMLFHPFSFAVLTWDIEPRRCLLRRATAHCIET